eukprot:Protomagalhaensia_wolfi_Nauph_80__986@NODE_156_length_3391_cov_99_648866_g117_i0_p2_GENE_NODE_156_length_3391_cov_99_648866_g117_i0NODE_156_length_3391_cov_99_648866_g117_i0_p2_ORF_typecomplete_len304_score52_74Methyltransf_31/PF13847_6/4_2e19Methyltransf_23/PF13489_6/8_5e17Ubie_methyltran/PF01209_18/1_1e16Methyltransf_25/PF13649_6/3_2e13Methyltransf_11/PF08241_12/4_6e03Methyltransf_11/PF08241_12/1_5e12Methyltransf_12/PF08242_12/1_6e03Methyltransf_12/PF08242_12/1_3e10MTS/PF05175_14/7_9e08TehB/PF
MDSHHHHHQPHHHEAPHSHEDVVALNREHFTADSSSYDVKPSVQLMSDLFALTMLEYDPTKPRKSLAETAEALDEGRVKELMAALTEKKDLPRQLIRPDSTVIDFACGTGLVASRLVPYMPEGKMIGIDISQGMLAKFEEKAVTLKEEHPHLEIKSICQDVLDASVNKSELLGSADLLYSTMAFHHFHDYTAVAQVLKLLVKPGGWILVFDMYVSDQEATAPVPDASLAHGRVHQGLTVSGLTAALRDNCVNVSAAREFTVKAWMPSHHVKQVSNPEVMAQLPRQGDDYYVDVEIILGVAQRA